MVSKKEKKALEEIGEKLRSLRVAAGYTNHEAFSAQYGLSRIQYWKMEAGKTNLTMTSLLRILAIHKIALSDFFHEIQG